MGINTSLIWGNEDIHHCHRVAIAGETLGRLTEECVGDAGEGVGVEGELSMEGSEHVVARMGISVSHIGEDQSG